jgi:hypothetical protein
MGTIVPDGGGSRHKHSNSLFEHSGWSGPGMVANRQAPRFNTASCLGLLALQLYRIERSGIVCTTPVVVPTAPPKKAARNVAGPSSALPRDFVDFVEAGSYRQERRV